MATCSMSGKRDRGGREKRKLPLIKEDPNPTVISLKDLETEQTVLTAIFNELPRGHELKNYFRDLLHSVSSVIKETYRTLFFSSCDVYAVIEATFHPERVRVNVSPDLWSQVQTIPIL